MKNMILLILTLTSLFSYSQTKTEIDRILLNGFETKYGSFTVTGDSGWIIFEGSSIEIKSASIAFVSLTIDGTVIKAHNFKSVKSFKTDKIYYPKGTYSYELRGETESVEGIPAAAYFSLGYDTTKTETPTSLYSATSLDCIAGENITATFQTDNSFGEYNWFKNDVLIRTTTTNSTSISVTNGDVIALTVRKDDPLYLESEKKSISISTTKQPGTLSFTGNTLACYQDTFKLTIGAAANLDNVRWYTDAALIDEIATGITDQGKKISIQNNINSNRNFSVYAVGYNKEGNCATAVKKIDLRGTGVPLNTTVTDTAPPYCGDVTFTVKGDFIHKIEWYKNEDQTGLIATKYDKTLTYDLNALSNGNQKIYYKAFNSNDCTAPLEEIDFRKIETDGSVSTVSQTTYCLGEAINVRLESTTSTTYEWYEDRDMNIPANPLYLHATNSILSYTPDKIGTKTWYYRGVSSTGCKTQLYSVNVTINNSPSNLQVTNWGETFCTNENAVFEASAADASSYKFYRNSSGTLEWDSKFVNGNKLEISGDEVRVGENKFWLKAISSSCESKLKEFSFYIKNAPDTPLHATGKTTYCVGETVTTTIFSAKETKGYQWAYDSAFNNEVEFQKMGTSDFSELKYVPTEAGVTTYYFRAKTEDCVSESNSLTITVKPQVGSVSVNGDGTAFCQGDTVELIAGAANASTYTWYTDAAGTIPSSNIVGTNNNTFRLTETKSLAPGEYKLYVRGENNEECNSELKMVRYTIRTTPANLQLVGETEYCTGESVLLTPSAINATSYQWAYDSNFNNLVEASKLTDGALSFAATSPENKTYYYRALNSSGCKTVVKNVTVNVLQGVTNLSVTNADTAVCQGESLQFVASATNASSYAFFDNDGLQISTSTSLTLDTGKLKAGTYTYKVQAFNTNGCTSDGLSFDFTVKPVPNTPTLSGGKTYCAGETIRLSATSSGATQMRWYTDELLNNEITADLSGTANETLSYQATAVGQTTYYVVASNDQSCSSDAQSLTITVKPQVGSVSVNGDGTAFCQGDTVELIAGAANASTYTWYTDAAGTIPSSNIVGTNNNTFRLTETKSLAPGEYKLYVRGENNEECNSELKMVRYTIRTTPANLQLVGETEYCVGETVQISAKANNAVRYQWYLDVNQFNQIDQTWLNALDGSKIEFISKKSEPFKIYCKAINDNGCETSLEEIRITVKAKPGQAAITNNNMGFCSNEKAVFEASAFSTDLFEWYKNEELTLVVEDELTNGLRKNKLSIDMSTLPPGTYTYYLVGVNNNGCKTLPTPLHFSVYGNPKEISVSGYASVCIGDSLNMEVSSEGASQFNWYYDSARNFPISSIYVLNNGNRIELPADKEDNGHIYVEGINENGCSTKLISFPYAFNPAPKNLNVFPISQTVCVGDIIEIEAGAENFNSFLWWKDPSGSVPFDEEKIKGTAKNKVYFETVREDIGEQRLYVQAVNDSGCLTELQSVTYEVLAEPTITTFSSNSTDNQFLYGQELELIIEGAHYSRYRILKEDRVILDWEEKIAEPFKITSFSDGTTQGTYTVEFSNELCQTSKEISIYVFDQTPEINHNLGEHEKVTPFGERIITINQNQHVTFSSNVTSSVYLKEWDFGDGFTSSGNPVTHHFNKEGQFYISLKITNTLTGAVIDLKKDIMIETLPEDHAVILDDFKVPEKEISFSPTPFKNKLTLKLDLAEGKDITLRIYDLNGLIVFVENFKGFLGENSFTWNNPLGAAPPGIYIASLNIEEENLFVKLIKE